MKKRIWELDVLRGLNVLWMMVIHFVYDITMLFPLITGPLPVWYEATMPICGISFIALSGICATLGTHPVRRGLTVLGGGMLCTLVTAALAWFGFCGREIIIYFGVLHCLGCCMLLWPLFRRLPGWLLLMIGSLLVALGWYLSTLSGETFWLIPLGVETPWFRSSDYYPLVRNLGIFLLGAGAARYLYREKVTLLQRVRHENSAVSFLGWWGKHSLPVYLTHQPVLAALAAVLYFAIL